MLDGNSIWKLRKTGNSNACMMRNLSCIYSLGILKPGGTGVLTEQFAPGTGELMFFNTCQC
jgi:hypothetical protein